MSAVSYHILGDSVVVSLPGQSPKTFRKSDGRYGAILAAVKEGKPEAIPAIIQGSSETRPSGVEFRAGTVYVDGSPLPDSLATRFAEYKAIGIPTDSLVLFWNKLKQNPNRNSVEMLYQFLDFNGHPITRDGNFIAYRYVHRSSDGKLVDAHTRTMDNSVGAIPEMPRDRVDSDPTRTCSTGLHVAAWDYVKGSDTLVEVEVDPRDVVCVPNDYNGTKMRVARFRVLNVIDKTLAGRDTEAPRTDTVYMEPVVGAEPAAVVKKDAGIVAKVRSIFTSTRSTGELKTKFKVKAKNGSFVKMIEFWPSRKDNGKGTLTVITSKGTWRFFDVGIVSANRLLNSKDQDLFYREKIKGTFEGARIK
jgi:hypothetical protein